MKPFVVMLAVGLGLATPTTQAQAQGLLDLGKNLLKELGDSSSSSGVSDLTGGEITAGLREALRIGAERVIGTLGQTDGFDKVADVHIPLPEGLKSVQSMLAGIGMSGLADELELRLNRAAETAVPKTQKLFVDAITQMSIEDAKRILNGPDDAATQYFRSRMAVPLADEMRPIVDRQIADVGAVAAYDQLISQYKTIPFVPDVKSDLTNHVLEGAIDGVFLYLAREEAAIRKDPTKRTTELLRKVFGQ